MSLNNLAALIQEFQSHVQNNQANPSAKNVLLKLKIEIATLLGVDEDLTKEQIANLREALELCTLYSVHSESIENFDRFYAQLTPFYNDYVPENDKTKIVSQMQSLIVGLRLMRLLSANRVAEFHTELELLPQALRETDHIEYALWLERCVMEGAYNKLRAKQDDVPDSSYLFFTNRLQETLRGEVADTVSSSYEKIKLEDLKNFLMLESASDVEEFVKKQQWKLVKEMGESFVTFNRDTESKSIKEKSFDFITQTVSYASELEKIV